MTRHQIDIPRDQLADFCTRWKVTELSLFGSVLRSDFGPGSDVDVMVTFHPSATPTLFSLSRMQEELSQMFGLPVDVVTRPGVEGSRNEQVKQAILSSARALYAA